MVLGSLMYPKYSVARDHPRSVDGLSEVGEVCCARQIPVTVILLLNKEIRYNRRSSSVMIPRQTPGMSLEIELKVTR